MNKDEILAISRKENKNGDERDMKHRDKSYAVSAAVASLVCIIIATVEEMVLERSAVDIWLIYVAIEFTMALSGAILSKKKWLIGLSVLMGVLFLGFLYSYIVEVVGLL